MGGVNGQIWEGASPSLVFECQGVASSGIVSGSGSLSSGSSVLIRIKDKTTIRPGTTQMYYPNASMGPSRFQYFVEGTDRWGNLPEAGQPVECEVLDGVLPLHHHQQGYGDTQSVYLVNSTQEKPPKKVPPGTPLSAEE